MAELTRNIPTLTSENGPEVLRAMLQGRSLLTGLSAMHRVLGSPFQITMPVFRPVILVGPESNRYVLVTHRDQFLWRTESDPVTHLLRHGVLVEDGERHDQIRAVMDPSLHRGQVAQQVNAMWHYTGRALDQWQDGSTLDMLVEMRKAALLILMGSLFGEDVEADIERVWQPILKSIHYISPGPWILWPGMPRPGYARYLEALDDFLYELIANRRAAGADSDDLLSVLINHPEMNDDLVRDQLLTLLIAGHDTSTALLAWVLYLFGLHPDEMERARREVDSVLPAGDRTPGPEELRRLEFLDAVIKETLRLYPPIHIGNRRTAEDVQMQGYTIPAGTRVMYSIFLSHRDPQYWSEPDAFIPDRFMRENIEKRPPLTYVPFGGGPRNCIGAAFSQIEAKIVLVRILQRFNLELVGKNVHPHMGATLEPRPGVSMRISIRSDRNPSG